MKNLETEYKSLANSDLPDLWSRIESALPEKTNNVNDNVVPFAAANSVAVEAPIADTAANAVNVKRRNRNFGKYMGIAAACVAGLIGIRVFIGFMNSGSRSYTASAPASYSNDDVCFSDEAPAAARSANGNKSDATESYAADACEEAADYTYDASNSSSGFSDAFLGGTNNEDAYSIDAEDDEDDESVSDNSVSENSISENAADGAESDGSGAKKGAVNE